MKHDHQESYGALKNKLGELQAAIEEARKREIESVLASIRKTMIEYGITERDLFGERRRAAGRNGRLGRLKPKYRNPETGETWAGRGRPPRWISGKRYDAFLIRPDA
ncbi:H-NS histone family protein [Burkholderia stagnalis]|uniref:DNA-binding protein n=1 Tax=Burkholderia stagnalis TaxID=1503054 RepID=A0A119WSY6_9BURK|nr:H-NS histone family protein [Burkholderia stagnalis]AOK57175.1 DNA-binding protein [Burkholderia stagnalis]KVM86208.1 DNA-binding protein [Burkholderia stagnalis]KVN05737.1 DNA-binding protein [Burkholderia stagnalis]KVN23185.1 DNA-binding protein [Burkholderia stagnalis]KVN68945.1 DNA-binding protein [Burkholderia stagnalis]